MCIYTYVDVYPGVSKRKKMIYTRIYAYYRRLEPPCRHSAGLLQAHCMPPTASRSLPAGPSKAAGSPKWLKRLFSLCFHYIFEYSEKPGMDLNFLTQATPSERHCLFFYK